MTREELDFIGSMNMCDEISNEAYKKIVCHCEEQEPCPDAINRQVVLEVLKDKWNAFSDANDAMQESINTIEALPPVNPQYTKNELQKMQDLEQAELEKAYELGKAEGQEYEDAISRRTVDEIKELMTDINGDTVYAVRMSDIRQLPSVKPQPKTGHWISHYDEDEKVGWYECDRCHTERAFNTKFCPDCGCRMVEPQERSEKE